ncbi:hypothetical protein HMN09_00666800 [Mycena chlorophos]|uniref:Uncharacterized protein n=1 Tax=Mycena chlorophos TaxID=658473 RepID=A0A8H6SZS5_MYCCL|nr:hypothetical protein HMN09_00666800 [Mycena chlorophos]
MIIALETWARDWADLYGPIFSYESDGDGKQRVALFVLCMNHEITRDNPLWKYVGELLGLNLRVGKRNLVAGADWRHIAKRWCTDICSEAGMVVDGIPINKNLMVLWLSRLPNYDWSEMTIEALLHPKDPQDVPRALRLLDAVSEIRKLEPKDYNPSERAELRVIQIIGTMFFYFLEPFINRDLSLETQVEYLGTFGLLLFVLYQRNETAFCSSQLFYDSQTLVKNAVFTVAKTQELNGDLPVYFCSLGDNSIEVLFGRVRSMRAHNPNFNITELCDTFKSAMVLDVTYDEYPHLERIARRLNAARIRHLDHIGPRSIRGDVRGRSCRLPVAWAAAYQNLDTILDQFDIVLPVPPREFLKRPGRRHHAPQGRQVPRDLQRS